MPECPHNDATIHYEISGSGPPLLLLAGMMSDSASWAPDNRSTGRTRPAGRDVTVAQMVQDALAVMDHLGHAKFHVAGHSMGGLMSMELAALVPDRVASVGVLASGRVRVPRTMAVFDALLAIRRAPQGEEMWLRALYPWVFRPGFFEVAGQVDLAIAAARGYPYQQTVDAMALQVEALRGFRPVARPEAITCPTLVLYAGHDVLIPPAQARAGFAGIAQLTEVEIADAGHSIHWDAPEQVTDAMLGFLRAQGV